MRLRGAALVAAAQVSFAELLQRSTSVVAVLAGHIHQAQGHCLAGGGALLVTAAAKDGGLRMLDFVPTVEPVSRL